MNKKLPPISSDEELEVFMEKDISEYINRKNFSPAIFEFMPKDAKINMRIPQPLLDGIKLAAKKKGISYQRYIRMALEDTLHPPG